MTVLLWLLGFIHDCFLLLFFSTEGIAGELEKVHEQSPHGPWTIFTESMDSVMSASAKFICRGRSKCDLI